MNTPHSTSSRGSPSFRRRTWSDYVFLVFEGEAAHATALQLAKEHVIEVSRWQDIVWELPSVIADVPADARCLYRWPVDRSE